MTYPTARIDADQSPVSAYSVRGASPTAPSITRAESEPDRPIRNPLYLSLPKHGPPSSCYASGRKTRKSARFCVLNATNDEEIDQADAA